MKHARKFWSAALALGLLTACGDDGDVTQADAASNDSSNDSSSSEPIKLGHVLPINSVQAALAKTQLVGGQIAADEINAAGGVLGRQIEIIPKDTKLETSRVGTVLRELNDEGVKLTFGWETSPECQAGAEAAVRLGQVVLANHCSSKTLYDPKPASPNYWMLSASGPEIAEAAGASLAKDMPDVDTWDVFGYDADITRSNWVVVQDAMKAAGNDITQNQDHWVPVDATSYRSQLASLSTGLKTPKDESGLFLSTYGAGTTSFLKQAEPLEVLDNYKAIVTLGAYWSSALAMDGASPDIFNVHEYFAGCQDNAMDKAFIAAYQEEMDTLPDAGAYQAYMGVRFYAEAIEKAGTDEPEAVQEAFDGLSVDTPTGQKMTMNGDTHKADSPLTVAHLVGDPDAPDGIKVISCVAAG